MIETTQTETRGVTAAPGTTKARIERAALGLFVEKGVAGATTREIAGAAGVSEGALYRYFKSKEAIAQHLFAAIHEKLAGLVRNAGTSAEGVEAQAEAVIDAYCGAADEDWTLFTFHLLSIDHFLPTPPGRDDPVSATEDIIAAAIDRGELPACDARILAAMALGVVLQPALHKAYGRLDAPLSAYADQFKSAIRAVLSSTAPRP
ncbi:MAG: TetR/AcrR family transcriptional regulator [Pseudomonadota bacterium]